MEFSFVQDYIQSRHLVVDAGASCGIRNIRWCRGAIESTVCGCYLCSCRVVVLRFEGKEGDITTTYDIFTVQYNLNLVRDMLLELNNARSVRRESAESPLVFQQFSSMIFMDLAPVQGYVTKYECTSYRTTKIQHFISYLQNIYTPYKTTTDDVLYLLLI